MVSAILAVGRGSGPRPERRTTRACGERAWPAGLGGTYGRVLPVVVRTMQAGSPRS